MSTDYRAALERAELALTAIDKAAFSEASDFDSMSKMVELVKAALADAYAALAQPAPVKTPMPIRPDCFEFAMDFLGDPEEAELRNYIEALEARQLAQPKPVGLTPDHVNLICFALEREPWATWLRRGGCLESAHCELSDLMLAALARWGRPAIEPEERWYPNFADWLEREMPEGTVIGDPLWWASKIATYLQRYGRPAIKPVPVAERLPGPEDCNADDECWWFDPAGTDGAWYVDTYQGNYTHWLPHWALPVPTSQENP